MAAMAVLGCAAAAVPPHSCDCHTHISGDPQRLPMSPDDLKAAIACVELYRNIGNSAARRPFTKREVI
jgi:hypothetical protein